MKFNLKNRPIQNPDAPRTYFKEAVEWFEGFEKELIGKITSGSPKAHLKNELIKEILGEDKE